MNYHGYLSTHVATILALHSARRTPRQIAEVLYAGGARAGDSDHIASIAQMVAYVLRGSAKRHMLSSTTRQRSPRPCSPSAGPG
jgi:hypothetical protein